MCFAGLLDAVACFDFFVAETRSAGVFGAGFEQVEVVHQVFDFLADGGEFGALLADGAGDFAFECLSHKRLSGGRSCG